MPIDKVDGSLSMGRETTMVGRGSPSPRPSLSRAGSIDTMGRSTNSSPQPRVASRNAACTTVSSTLRNRYRSFLVRGAGPPVFVPSSLRCLQISRPTSAFPIFASVHCLPVAETTRAPLLRQRDANGISEGMHTSVDEMCSAIQSSAASALSPTRIILTFGRIGLDPLETTKTLSRRRAATR